jgi:hypothetical protein
VASYLHTREEEIRVEGDLATDQAEFDATLEEHERRITASILKVGGHARFVRVHSDIDATVTSTSQCRRHHAVAITVVPV